VSERPTFYVDRCVGKRVVRDLRAAGARVEAHDDHFAQNEPDESWIPDVAARGWVILTKDKNIRRRAGEREAVVTASARIITLTSGNMSGETMSGILVANIAAMEQLAASQPAPFVAVLGPGGMQVVIPKPIPPEAQGGREPTGSKETPPDAPSGS
jgi:predicted nuclease of predicted toxin-antitoxin system